MADACGAKKTTGEGVCKNPAGSGTAHLGIGNCKFHGGATPSQEKHYAKELARAAVDRSDRKGVLWYGNPDEKAEPGEALLLEVRRTSGHVKWLEREIATKEKPENPDIVDVSMLQGMRALYLEERQHLLKVCQVALNAGVEERRVRIAEKYGDTIATLLENILAELKLTKEQQKRAPEIVRAQLRLVEDAA